jgi:hypothetical protein
MAATWPTTRSLLVPVATRRGVGSSTMDAIPSGSRPGSPDEHRTADLTLLPAGDGLVLVDARNGQDPRYLRAQVVDLLLHCRTFATLDDHVRAYCRGRQANTATMLAMRRELERLAHDGYLVSRRGLLEALRKPVEPTPTSPISCIAFPTCNRVETLLQNLTGYVESCLLFDRNIDFVVVDDSPSARTRERCRRMLWDLKSRYGVNVAYAGLEEKLAFARSIAQLGDVPPDVVEFACVGDKRHDLTTVGANRNAILLHTVGDRIFSTDDDVVCRLAASPRKAEGVAISSEGSPLEAWFFPNSDMALRSLDFVARDLVGLHEEWLGRNPWACLADRHQDDPVVLDNAQPALLRRLGAPADRVAVTLNGVAGDCAWDNPFYYLFQRDETIRRSTRSEEEYRIAQDSREIIQAVDRTTITERAEPMLAMCVGLDNRELLPPFTPIGRAEDVAFGVLLSRCFEATYAVHLPWVLLHAPPEPRSFSAQQMFSVGFNAWLPSCLGLLDLGLARAPDERLRRLGQQLEELGHLPRHSFEEFVRSHLWHSMSSLVSELEERLTGPAQPPPSFLAEDMRSLIALARRSALTPVDQLYAIAGGREPTQRLIAQFGRVLGWWPTMVEVARRMRAAGRRLAQPV